MRPPEAKVPSPSENLPFRYLRLWQDPFEPFKQTLTSQGTASITYAPNESANSKEAPNLQATLANDTDTPNTLIREISSYASNGTVLILPAILPGGPYVEERETRARLRYSIISRSVSSNKYVFKIRFQ